MKFKVKKNNSCCPFRTIKISISANIIFLQKKKKTIIDIYKTLISIEFQSIPLLSTCNNKMPSLTFPVHFLLFFFFFFSIFFYHSTAKTTSFRPKALVLPITKDTFTNNIQYQAHRRPRRRLPLGRLRNQIRVILLQSRLLRLRHVFPRQSPMQRRHVPFRPQARVLQQHLHPQR